MRKLLRHARRGVLTATAAVGAITVSFALALPATAQITKTPGNSIIVGSGSNTTYFMMEQMDVLFNEALGCLRRRRPAMDISLVTENPVLNAQIISFPHANPELDPETAMAQREIRSLLERAIDKLPEPFRGVLVARLIEGMSVDETAELFGILPQTVKTRLHRARALLKREMENHIGPVSAAVKTRVFLARAA